MASFLDADIDHEEAVQALGDRLEDLEKALPSLSGRDLRQHVHSFKGLAACYGYSVLAGLAHELETELGSDDAATPARSRLLIWLEAMADALVSGRPHDMDLLDDLLVSVGTPS